jgi:hypothetical protein
MVQHCINWCNTNLTSGDELTACGFFNFENGKSRARLSPEPEAHRWQESRCHFAKVGVFNDDLDSEVRLIQDSEFDHFSEICVKKGNFNTISQFPRQL